jgi:hypothetical protein
MFFRAPQHDTEGRAPIHLRLILQRAAMLFDDPRRNGKAEPRARVLGREERIEEAFFHFRRDLLPVSVTSKHHVRVRSASRLRSSRARSVTELFCRRRPRHFGRD